MVRKHGKHRPGHPRPTEQPQAYDWAHMNNGFLARLVLPFFSTKYKTDMTMHCILKAFAQSLPSDDEAQLLDEQTALLRELPDNELWRAPSMRRRWDLYSFFSLYYVHLHCAAPLLFRRLRNQVFHLSPTHYARELSQPLRPVDGLGFSGSLFFFTTSRSFIIKSIGRAFEYEFLYGTLLHPLFHYFSTHTNTLLSQITDVLYSFDHRLGSYLGVSPSHYVVMTNVLECLDTDRGCAKWDLKPQSFWEPTRDVVPDTLKTEQAKSGLADELGVEEHMVLTAAQKEHLLALLRRDTAFLEEMETIDYSLLLGRYPVEMFHERKDPGVERDPLWLREDGEGEGEGGDWTNGVRSADGKWVYKCCLLDFLWNVNMLRPKIFRKAGKVLPEQTITTEPGRYRRELLRMMDEYIDVWHADEDERDPGDGGEPGEERNSKGAEEVADDGSA